MRAQPDNSGMRRHEVGAIVVTLLGLSLLTVGCGSTSPTATKATTTSSDTSSTTATTTTEPTVVPTDAAVWPFAASTTRYHDPIRAATDFAVAYLGFVKPVVGPFVAGDTRSGEVDVRANAHSTATTTVMVRKLAPDETWWVLGAATPHLVLQSPAWNASITSKVTVAGRSTAFEATVNVEIRQDGSLTPLGTDFFMGGANGTMGPFSKAVAFATPTAKRGAIVFEIPSTEGGGTLEAGAIRVQFP